jgi:hypothetical protein
MPLYQGAPNCRGEAKARPSGDTKVQEKSSVSLTKVEWAVRIKVKAIASAAAAQ